MKIARLHLSTVDDGSEGYRFFGSMREAEKAKTEHKRANRPDRTPNSEIDTIEVDPSRVGIIAALNRYAGHPDNG